MKTQDIAFLGYAESNAYLYALKKWNKLNDDD